MIILVLNCGSSSIKYQLFDMANREVIAKGGIEKLGMKGSVLKHSKNDGQKVVFEGEILDHKSGIEYILGVLTSVKHGCLKTLEQIDAVGQRELLELDQLLFGVKQTTLGIQQLQVVGNTFVVTAQR